MSGWVWSRTLRADAWLSKRQEGGGGNGANVANSSAAEAHLTPEEYWCPEQQPVEGGYTDAYGAISSLPEHDGTECLKWDESLWSHAEHFRVGPGWKLVEAHTPVLSSKIALRRGHYLAARSTTPRPAVSAECASIRAVSLERVQGTAQRDRDK